jgi:hypothetical protein
MAPSPSSLAAFGATCKELSTVATAWQRLSTTELGAVNETIKSRGGTVLTVAGAALRLPSCS